MCGMTGQAGAQSLNGEQANVADKETKRGRPKQLDREAIVRAAAGFPQAELSLNGLAKALDVTPQSLYHYFPSIGSIDAAVAELIATAVPKPDPALPWSEYVRETILLYRSWVLEHNFPVARGFQTPGLAFFRVAGRRSEAVLRRCDEFLGVFKRDGFSPEQAMSIWMFLQNFLRRSDFHAVRQADMETVWRDLKDDIVKDPDSDFEHLNAILSIECPSIDDMYLSVVDRFMESVTANYDIE